MPNAYGLLMIWESHPWKRDLLRRSAWLTKQHKVLDWPEAAMVRVEQCVMIGCYCTRKLIEAKKLTDRVSTRDIPLLAYPAKGKPIHSMNWHKIDQLYELEAPKKLTKPLRFVCNQLIHSFVFSCGFNQRGGLSFILFCSEQDRNKHLFQVSTRVLANAFGSVGKDGVWSSSRVWNENKKDYDYKNR